VTHHADTVQLAVANPGRPAGAGDDAKRHIAAVVYALDTGTQRAVLLLGGAAGAGGGGGAAATTPLGHPPPQRPNTPDTLAPVAAAARPASAPRPAVGVVALAFDAAGGRLAGLLPSEGCIAVWRLPPPSTASSSWGGLLPSAGSAPAVLLPAALLPVRLDGGGGTGGGDAGFGLRWGPGEAAVVEVG